MRALTVLGFFVSVAKLMACGQGAFNPPKPTPRDDVETRVTPPKPGREIPHLIAPPPAYGNKIVMAHRESSRARN